MPALLFPCKKFSCFVVQVDYDTWKKIKTARSLQYVENWCLHNVEFLQGFHNENDISAVREIFSSSLEEGLPMGANFLRPFLCSSPPQACNLK